MDKPRLGAQDVCCEVDLRRCNYRKQEIALQAHGTLGSQYLQHFSVAPADLTKL